MTLFKNCETLGKMYQQMPKKITNIILIALIAYFFIVIA